MFSLVIFTFFAATLVSADVYMHNPRGSNDRNCERNDNRNNGNRLFDSQNNDKGGYACPRAVGGPEVVTPTMYYYEGSKLQVDWTAQHSCNNENVQCQMVIQYMCSPSSEDAPQSKADPYYYLLNPWIRDGTPSDANDAATDRMDVGQEADPRYGSHELYAYYSACRTRSRNRGLWLNDQVNIGNGADATRQQNQNRRGWECQEERDYYPYWHPSPWKDIAVMTTDTSMCGYYQRESQNVMEKGWCMDGNGNPVSFNQHDTCVSSGNQWVVVPAWGIEAPECLKGQWERDNALGDVSANNDHQLYEWTLPKVDKTWNKCILRLRYNISSYEVDFWLDSNYNLENSPIKPTNPRVNIAGRDTETRLRALNVSMKVNGNQYGRTFQDRSYVFNIKSKSDETSMAPESGVIWNLNVRGKRGNIVQAFPAVEYDFVPRVLEMNQGDYVHFQWTGSDYNPNRNPNDGIGGPVDPANANNYRSDRSNVVPHNSKWQQIKQTDDWFGLLSKEQMVSLAYINQNYQDCLTYEQLYLKNNGNRDQIEKDSSNCMMLNAARTPYYDLAQPVQMRKAGTYQYMSTRNNNFSNRNQMGKIVVKEDAFSATEKAAIGVGAVVGVGALAGAGYYGYTKKF
eukprot:c9037_g1_i1.p1 GENE.c9037_g1_i1~~c9037_g1_i1.p1  ORF type:complete len:626 (-),score=58.71 c9037_g1_i1:164-2041(-)